MLEFILGVLLGSFITFVILVIFKISKTDEAFIPQKPNPDDKETGDNNDPSK